MAPADINIAFDLGLAYVRTARYAEGIPLLKPAVSNPALAFKARFLIGVAYFELHRYPEAAAQLEPLRPNPEHQERVLYFLEEKATAKSGNAAPAEQAFSDLLRKYPKSALVHKLLGTAHDAEGNVQQALAEFQQAAEIDPTLPEVKFDIALLYLKQRDDAEARRWLRGELELNSCYAPAPLLSR